MKRPCLLLMLLIAGLLLLCGPSHGAETSQVKLLIAHWEGPEGAKALAAKKWASELEKRSNGRIVTEHVFGGALGKTPEHYDLAVRGLCDVAQVGLPFTPGKFPMAEVWDMPFARERLKGEDISLIFLELFKKGYFDRDFRDVVVVGLNVIGPYHFQMKGVPINTISDLRGKKIRVTGKVHTEMMKSLGAIPVGMPGSEIYSALEKGITDGVFTDWSAIPTFRYEKLLSYVTETPMCGMGFIYAMNRKKFDSLPEDLKKLIIEMRTDFTRFLGQVDDEKGHQGRELVLKSGGKIIQLPEEEVRKIGKVLESMWKGWIAEGEKMGLPRREMLKDLGKLLKDKGVKEPFLGASF